MRRNDDKEWEPGTTSRYDKMSCSEIMDGLKINHSDLNTILSKRNDLAIEKLNIELFKNGNRN